jgi:RNA polymerase sigma-70 factor (ECF subfamily)
MTQGDGSSDPLTRASLLVRLRTEPGNEKAWNEFLERYAPQIYGWCRRWGLREADAEDVTQVVLLRLVLRIRRFSYDPSKRFRGWLKTVAHNAWRDYFSDQQRQGVGSGDSRVADMLGTVEARDDLVQRIEAACEQELLDLASERVKARVEPHTWEAFRLMTVEGRSGAEVATALNMQVGTVFKAKSKVQRMLREEVEQLEEEAVGGCPCNPAPNPASSNGS